MLEVRAISAGYGTAQALWDIDINVGEGEIVTLVGPNGAGKSTFVNVVAGLGRAWSGSVVLDGQSLTSMAPEAVCGQGVAIVPEGRRLFPDLTVADNLDIGAFHPAARAKRDETYEWVSSIFPIVAERSNQRASTLSGGQQQMVAIGRALMARPKLLLLDEPSLGLAPVIVEQIFDVIRDINQGGTSVLIVEQNVVEALELASRAYVLENGRIVRHGDAAELLTDESLQKAYFGM
jgi:branched-chain amino acid transport system ATP-binding protein